MAQAFPNSTFVGSDYHEGSIETARAAGARTPASRDRVTLRDRVRRPATTATALTSVTMFDCLHDMGDPVGAAATSATSLGADGTWLIVEPMRRRPRRGQPQPGRPCVLRVLDVPVHAGLAVAGRRARARRPGRPGADRRRRRGRRVHPLPARGRDAVQHGARGPSVSTTMRPRGRAATREPRARLPDREGFVERDGVRVYWEAYGEDGPAILLLPAVVDRALARCWKAPDPRTSRGTSASSTFDGRGNGLSDRPAEAAAYAGARVRGRRRRRARRGRRRAGAALVGALVRRADGADRSPPTHPERVDGIVCIGADRPDLAPAHPSGSVVRLRRACTTPTRAGRSSTATPGCATTADFARVLLRPGAFPSRTRPSRSRTAVGWGLDTDARDAEPDTTTGDLDCADRGRGRGPVPRRRRCPVLVVHGDRRRDQSRLASGERAGRADRRRARARWRAPATARTARDPVAGQPAAARVRRSADRRSRPRRARGAAGASARKRALFVSSPIGLGHAWRDVAIADELRRQVPGLEIHWLAQEPVTTVLRERGETIHPAERRAGQRVGAHRPRGRRARPARLPGAAADGRDLLRQLHGVRRPRRTRTPTTCGSATRPGRSTTSCTRTPSCKTAPLRVADRLRRLPADAGRRRARGVPGRRLQRRDDRAHRALPERARPGDLRRRARRHRRRTRSAPGCPRSATGPSATSTSPATSPGFDPADVRATGRRCARELGYGDEPLLRHLGRRLGRRRRAAAPGGRGAARRCASAYPTCARSSSTGPRHRPGDRCRPPTGSRCAATSTSSTATWRRATSALVQGG